MEIEHIIKRNNPYRYPSVMKKIKSFDEYAEEVRIKKLADKMLVDNLVSQLAEAKANSLPATDDETKKMLIEINENTKYVRNIYSKPKPSKNSTKKENAEQKKMELINSILRRGKKGL